jgi:hypothetical protein
MTHITTHIRVHVLPGQVLPTAAWVQQGAAVILTLEVEVGQQTQGEVLGSAHRAVKLLLNSGPMKSIPTRKLLQDPVGKVVLRETCDFQVPTMFFEPYLHAH